MKYFIHYLLFCFLFSLITFPASAQICSTNKILSSANHSSLTTRPVVTPPFHTLRVDGPINIAMKNDEVESPVLIVGDVDNVSHVRVDVLNNCLRLRMDAHYRTKPESRLTVYVNTAQVEKLIYNGNGSVSGNNLDRAPSTIISSGSGSIKLQGKNLAICQITASEQSYIDINGLQTSQLTIKQTGDSHIVLRGNIVLQEVNSSGNSTLDIYWVNSTYVNVRASDRSYIKLAGIADLLDVRLSQRAFLDAKNLRAEKGFINTTSNARADVSLQKVLGALASDFSDIYYYQDSYYVGGYMRDAGAVFRMNGIATNRE